MLIRIALNVATGVTLAAASFNVALAAATAPPDVNPASQEILVYGD